MGSPTGPKDVLVAVVVGLVLLGFLALAAVRTADLYFKAAWIATHFPPKGEVCTELFCPRDDTSRPDRGFLKLHFAYCPDHLPSGFQGRGGRSNGIVIYLTIFVTLLAFLSVPIFGALARILAWPILLPMKLAGKLPPGCLLPFGRSAASGPAAPGDWLEKAGMWTGAVVATAAIALYCWW